MQLSEQIQTLATKCTYPDDQRLQVLICKVAELARVVETLQGSSATPATATAAEQTCAKCGHPHETDPRGRCISVYYDAGGSLCYCGCKCEFAAATTDNDSDCQPGASSKQAFNVIDDQMSKELRED